MNFTEPKLIEGGLSIDDRGETIFVNAFAFEGVKRFYIVSNHQVGMVRAWHAHKNAEKYACVVQGSAMIGTVKIDNWENPSKDAPVQKFILSSHKPAMLFIPAGYANGAMTLTDDAKIIYFACDTLEETKQDDYRYPARYWDIWHVEER